MYKLPAEVLHLVEFPCFTYATRALQVIVELLGEAYSLSRPAILYHDAEGNDLFCIEECVILDAANAHIMKLIKEPEAMISNFLSTKA